MTDRGRSEERGTPAVEARCGQSCIVESCKLWTKEGSNVETALACDEVAWNCSEGCSDEVISQRPFRISISKTKGSHTRCSGEKGKRNGTESNHVRVFVS